MLQEFKEGGYFPMGSSCTHFLKPFKPCVSASFDISLSIHTCTNINKIQREVIKKTSFLLFLNIIDKENQTIKFGKNRIKENPIKEYDNGYEYCTQKLLCSAASNICTGWSHFSLCIPSQIFLSDSILSSNSEVGFQS